MLFINQVVITPETVSVEELEAQQVGLYGSAEDLSNVEEEEDSSGDDTSLYSSPRGPTSLRGPTSPEEEGM